MRHGESGPASIALRCGGVEVRLVSPVVGQLALAMRDEVTGETHLLPVDSCGWVWFAKSAEVVARSALGVNHGDAKAGGDAGASSGLGLGGRCGKHHGDGRCDAGVPAEATASADVGAFERGRADLPAESGGSVGKGAGQ